MSFYILKTLTALIKTEKNLYQSLICVYILFNQPPFSLTQPLLLFRRRSITIYVLSLCRSPSLHRVHSSKKKKYRNTVPRQKALPSRFLPKAEILIYTVPFFFKRVSDYKGELSGKNFLPIFGHSFTSKPLFVLLPITP